MEKPKRQNKFQGIQMKAPSQEALLEEYKICDQAVTRLDNLIWQMAAIVFPITLAGLAYFGVNQGHGISELITLMVVAVGSTILLLNWYLLSRHWAGYQKIAIYRMREIEAEIGTRLYRYNGFISLSPEDRRERIDKTLDNEEKEMFDKLYQRFGKFPFFGLFRSMKLVTSVFILGWIALICREIFFIFS